ncbi:MAG TPA: hypothetical protein VIL12_07360 [Acidimicrobiia bacterium]
MQEEEPEQMERIPWAELVAQPRIRRPWVAYAVIGSVVLGAAWMLGTRSPQVPPTATLPDIEAAPVTAPEPLITPTEPEVVAPLYSEADLMAVGPVTDPQSVLARAEWFVLDYFTNDGDEVHRAEVFDVLPEGVDIVAPSMPAEPYSYVAWARALGVSEADPGIFEVLVAYRQLASADGARYTSLPVRAVTVRVGTGPAGESFVLDLPLPALLPSGRADPLMAVEQEPPERLAAQALERAGAWGADPEILSSALVGDEWRMVLLVGDSTSGRWPVVVWLPETG